MEQAITTPNTSNDTGSMESNSLRKIILLMLRNWYLYFTAFVLFAGGGVLYLKYRLPTYMAEALILVEEEDNSPTADILEGFAMRPGIQNLDNQILILQSKTMIKNAIEDLPFEIDVYKKGLFSQSSYYPMSPLRIEEGSQGLPYQIEFIFQYIGEENFRLSTSSKERIVVDTTGTFGKELLIDGGSFIIYPVLENESMYKSRDKLFFQFYETEILVSDYTGSIYVENATRDGSIIRISHENTNNIKGLDFLTKLTEVFVASNLEKKNLEAQRIIEFIEGQLTDVRDSLDVTEVELQEFRSQNRIMDVSAQTQQIINQAVLLENEQARLNLERNYYVYLNNYMTQDNNRNSPIAPASMGITDPNLTSLIQELSSLQAEFFSSGVGERNPMQGQLQMKIRNTKTSIIETLSGIMQANQMAMAENNNQINRLNRQASSLPEKEQQLLGFERRFNLNNVMYTFLLERRAEAQIQKASNAPDHEIVDIARSAGIVSPIPMIVLALCLSLAVVVPSFLLLVFSALFNTRIVNEEDVNFITSLPILAEFPHSRLSYYNVALTDPSSRIAEAFRSLRIRMDFFTKEIECPLILISSSIPAEGKTYTAVNLASVYSMMGKKTLLVGFDLRRPTLLKSFEIEKEYGAVDYLIGKKPLNEVIYESGYDNLEILPSGSIPPNPSELSGTLKAKQLFSELKKKYECIIVDSPPIGVVSDAYPLATEADAMLIVLRHGHTKKHALRSTLLDLHQHSISNIGLLINDVKLSSNSYRYNYKYKYEFKSVNGTKSIEKKSRRQMAKVLKKVRGTSGKNNQ
jgi:capsular exopolysaccharide synthesis family protein